MRYPKTISINPNRVEVAPFEPKLCQNDTPELRNILEAFLGTKIRNSD